MESSWWACESCHSVNHPGASACYKCRAFKGQQHSGTAQTSPTGSTSFPTPVVPYGNPTTASYGVPSAAQYWPGIPAPQGAVIAGMGVRTGAWILDALLAGPGFPCTPPSSSTTSRRSTQQKSAKQGPTGCWRRNLKPLTRKPRSRFHAVRSVAVGVLRNSRALSICSAARAGERVLR